jgi:hypothetical protein
LVTRKALDAASWAFGYREGGIEDEDDDEDEDGSEARAI